MKGRRTTLAAAALFVGLAAGLIPLGAHRTPAMAEAQNLGQRSVSGDVVDADSSLVSGAIVFLKNQKTKAIRSYTTAMDGRFHFAQVSMSDDFDLWAEKGGKKSSTRTVSSWDTRAKYIVELKIK
ncbi:MAG TPA: carboxypeptidase-like regulatory domain-containing protein [Terracidiphilus sp.]|nr:carboxypeptidase-like regulatory domain-containing protein [Terracidiphilus sp.]